MRVTEGNTDLRGRQTLAGELADVLDDVVRSSLEPRRGGRGGRGGRRTLSENQI